MLLNTGNSIVIRNTRGKATAVLHRRKSDFAGASRQGGTFRLAYRVSPRYSRVDLDCCGLAVTTRSGRKGAFFALLRYRLIRLPVSERDEVCAYLTSARWPTWTFAPHPGTYMPRAQVELAHKVRDRRCFGTMGPSSCLACWVVFAADR